MCKYSKFRIESNSYLLFDSKPMQLFEIFEYLFNGDQPGDWHAICLYFASQKLLHSRVSWTQCCAACVPTPPTPLSALTTHARTGGGSSRACVLPAPGLDRGVWLRYNCVRQTQRMVSWALALLSVFLRIQLYLVKFYCTLIANKPRAPKSAVLAKIHVFEPCYECVFMMIMLLIQLRLTIIVIAPTISNAP